MGRKKIQISRITDERNRQVRVINVCYSIQLLIGHWISRIAASNWNISLIFSLQTIFGNYISMCHSFMEIDLTYKDQLLALKLSLINFWPLEFSLLWSVSIKFNTFQNNTRTDIVNATTSKNIQTRCDGCTGKYHHIIFFIYSVIQSC